MPNLRIGVVTLGNWGSALAQHLAVKGHEVIGWSNSPQIVDGINKRRCNPLYHREIDLNQKIKATNDLGALTESEILVLACPSAALAELVQKIPVKHNAVWVSAIKGFVNDAAQTPLQFLTEYCSENSKITSKFPELAVISGPSFAKDVIAQHPVGLVAASTSEVVAQRIAEEFSSEAMRVYTSCDPLGVEIGGILKNVIALAAGVSDGLGLGESAKAGLVTRGLAEMVRLATAMGAQGNTIFGLSGLGDLTMSATCDASRNRTVGLRLGAGERLPDILNSLDSVAEGVRSTPLVMKLAKEYQVYMPICEAAGRLLRGEVTAKQVLVEIIIKPPKKEW